MEDKPKRAFSQLVKLSKLPWTREMHRVSTKSVTVTTWGQHCRLHWLAVKQWILYKTAVITFKVRQTSTPADLSCHIKPRDCARHLRSSDNSLIAPSTSPGVVSVCRLQLLGTLFLEWYLIDDHSQSSSPDSKPPSITRLAITPSNYINWPELPPPSKLRPYGGIYIC